MNDDAPQAALIVIGNEILSGRTQDLNLAYIARKLAAIGVSFAEARVVPDITACIIEAVNALRARYDYVFTTGGIGPTHDDLTVSAVAMAFGRECTMHPEALAAIELYYGKDNLNPGRLKMATMPEGAVTVPNGLGGPPGFRVENVYVLAGVPRIMQSMFDHVASSLRQGAPVLSEELETDKPESSFAEILARIQQGCAPHVQIGSYPYLKDGRPAVKLAVRSICKDKLSAVCDEINTKIVNN